MDSGGPLTSLLGMNFNNQRGFNPGQDPQVGWFEIKVFAWRCISYKFVPRDVCPTSLP